MKLKRITLDGIIGLHPCEGYTRERVKALMGKRRSVNALDVLDADIPPADRLWLVLREDMLPAKLLRELACDFAQSAFDRYGNGDERSQIAIDLAVGCAAGVVSEEDLAAAREAAWAAMAAWAARAARAAGEAAGKAARASAWAAAREAAWAARAAARGEAGEAGEEQVVHASAALRKARGGAS